MLVLLGPPRAGFSQNNRLMFKSPNTTTPQRPPQSATDINLAAPPSSTCLSSRAPAAPELDFPQWTSITTHTTPSPSPSPPSVPLPHHTSKRHRPPSSPSPVPLPYHTLKRSPPSPPTSPSPVPLPNHASKRPLPSPPPVPLPPLPPHTSTPHTSRRPTTYKRKDKFLAPLDSSSGMHIIS